ncbi:cadherin-like beta sandwich domain-containing protein [Candidatus Stoquefichus sp. SB1]|uniref:cadherin-like beta sandwich domain-containing protein n=1 Tax=Candidatus Stoquefichus sp. SB1 TaxID=1658109 RepID=UPI0009E4631F|nr:cadherin-like beta sandwich domain-containing protein [Candidatus Stoquefichus sp. SB1]
MKKSKVTQFLLGVFVCIGIIVGNTQEIYAASYSVSISASSVSAGGEVKVTVNGNGCEGSFSVSANNGATVKGANPIWTGESTTVKAGSSSFTITVSPVSVADSNTGKKITDLKSTSKNISIKAPSSNNGGGSTSSGGSTSANTGGTTTSDTSTKEKDTRSTDNLLSSLTVSEGTLNPSFSSNKTSYSINLTSDITSLTIDAKAKDSKAKVSGIGKKDIVIGSQTFEVVVTAENGSKKTYAITVNVTEKPTVFTQFGNQKLGLLIDVSKVDGPKGYVGTSLELENTPITGWKNETNGLVLVYLMDESGNKNFYICENGKIMGKYETIEINGKSYTLIDIPSDIEKQDGLKRSKVKIGDLEIEGWTFEDQEHANYSVVYLMNDAGEKNLYSYESTEGTLQKYVPSIEKNEMGMITYIFIGTTVVFAATSIGLLVLYMNFKKKSISAIKDYYASKNQDFD